MPVHSKSDAATLTLECPAKVNLALSVGPPLEKDSEAGRRGYHPIASWMVGVTFGDRLTVRRVDDERTMHVEGATVGAETGAGTADRTESDAAASGDARQSRSDRQFDVAFAPDAPQPQRIDWPLESDLVYRAHRLLEARAGRSLPVSVTLRKQVPAGAGLAGGSADAAGMLLAVNALFELQLTPSDFHDICGQLGSDVSFSLAAMTGQPAAIVTGQGEHLEPLPSDAPLHLVLILPPLTCPTGGVYQAFDASMGRDHRLDAGRVRRLAEQSRSGGAGRRDLEARLFNDLAAAAMQVAPALKEVRDRVRAAAGRPVHVTGSGAGLFVLADSPEEAADLAEKFRSGDVPAVATGTMGNRSTITS